MSSGKYEGTDEILMIGTSEGVAQKVAEVAKENFEKLGFKVRLRLVTQDAMYTKFCKFRAPTYDVCPNVGWFKDFSDPQTMLSPTFDGKNILPQNNSTGPQLDVPEINERHDQGRGAHRIRRSGPRRGPRSTSRSPTRRRPSRYQWEKAPLLQSSDVNGVVNEFYPGSATSRSRRSSRELSDQPTGDPAAAPRGGGGAAFNHRRPWPPTSSADSSGSSSCCSRSP